MNGGEIYWLSDDATDSKVYPYQIPEYDSTLLVDAHIKDVDEQYWRKQVMPKGLSVLEAEAWKKLEVKRVVKGCWFYVRGELTYINGIYYIFLQYTKSFDPIYVRGQRDYAYFLELVDTDPNCLGNDTKKPRRGGASYIEHARVVRKSILTKNKEFGLLSLDMKKVKEVLSDPIIKFYNGLPSYLKPKGEVAKMSIKYQGKDEEHFDFLHNTITAKSLTTTAYDGMKLYHLSIDEVWKIINKVDVSELISVHKQCFIDQVRNQVVGKLSLVSTIGTDKVQMKKAIEVAISTWIDSNYMERDEEGKTKSGLYRYFISALDVRNIDKYGEANRERTQKELDKKKEEIINENGINSTKYVSYCRENPATISDIVDSVDNSNFFGDRPPTRLKKVLEIPIAERGYVRYCYFVNEKGDVDIDYENYNPDCHWKGTMTNIPKPNMFNRMLNGVYYPPRNPEGIVGYDGIRYNETLSNHVSQAGAIALRIYNHHQKLPDNNHEEIIGQLIGRMRTDDIDEQVFLCARYHGFMVSYERQVEGTEKWATNNGYKNYIIVSPFDKLRGIHKDDKLIERGTRMIKDMIRKPKTKDEYDFLESIKYEELLKQLCTFELKKYTEHDLMSALYQAVVGTMKIYPTIFSSSGGLTKAINQLFGM